MTPRLKHCLRTASQRRSWPRYGFFRHWPARASRFRGARLLPGATLLLQFLAPEKSTNREDASGPAHRAEAHQCEFECSSIWRMLLLSLRFECWQSCRADEGGWKHRTIAETRSGRESWRETE